MKKTDKNRLRRMLQTLIIALMIIPAAISCSSPSSSADDDSDDQNEELEAERLQKKIEIYNKMLGSWESVDGSHRVNYFGTTENTIVLHIEPTRWYWSEEGEIYTATCMTWDKPFYNYIYLFEEWNADDFYKKDKIDEYRSMEGLKKYFKESGIFLDIKDYAARDNGARLFDISALPSNLDIHGEIMKRYTASGNGNGDDEGGETGGEGMNLGGSWSYEVPGQPNAGGTITFDDGTIRFQHKVGSFVSEASYTLSGNEMTIEYSYFEEKFNVSKENDRTISLEYKGNNSISQILGVFFQYMGSDNKITLTKN